MPQHKYTPTTLGYAILGLLHQEPSSGYQIRKVFETTPIGHYSSSPGSIYPALRRLQDEGLIEQIEASPESSSSKMKFSLTPAGAETLTAWLNEPVTREEVIRNVSDLILRFAFMTDLVDAAGKTAFLMAFKDEVAAYIVELKQFREAAGDSMPLHGLLAIDRGLEGYMADSRWAAHALEVVGDSLVTGH